MTNGTLLLLTVSVVSVLIFLGMREIWCWYWKINEALAELKAIRAALERRNTNLPKAIPGGGL